MRAETGKFWWEESEGGRSSLGFSGDAAELWAVDSAGHLEWSVLMGRREAAEDT